MLNPSVLMDQICGARAGLAHCKRHHIERSWPELGREPAGKTGPVKTEKQEERGRREAEPLLSLMPVGLAGAGSVTKRRWRDAA